MKKISSGSQIHLFKKNNTMLVLDVESGVLHQLDKAAWDMLSYLNKGAEKSFALKMVSDEYGDTVALETLHETEKLIKQGMLWSGPSPRKQTLEKSGFKDNNKCIKGNTINKLKHKNGQAPAIPLVKALCLNVAHTCNLSCSYCFAGKGEYGKLEGPPLMTEAVGKASIDFLLHKGKGRKRMEIDYFGGEPLLNLDVIKKTTFYAKKRGREEGVEFSFTLTTNGLLLDNEIQEYLQHEGFGVVLSLDGRPEVHDRLRVFANGSGSYLKVVERLQNFIQKWKGTYYIRGTYSRHNLDFSNDAFHLWDLGFEHISIEPVVGKPEDSWTLQEKDLPVILDQYDLLTNNLLNRKNKGEKHTFFHFAVDLEKGPCVYKRISGCGAGEEYLAVTPSGDLYPCHQLIGKEYLHMGNVHNNGQIDYLKHNIFPPSGPLYGECSKCWARYHCGGGCRAAALLVNNTYNRPYALECAMQKKRLECALYIKTMETSHGVAELMS